MCARGPSVCGAVTNASLAGGEWRAGGDSEGATPRAYRRPARGGASAARASARRRGHDSEKPLLRKAVMTQKTGIRFRRGASSDAGPDLPKGCQFAPGRPLLRLGFIGANLRLRVFLRHPGLVTLVDTVPDCLDWMQTQVVCVISKVGSAYVDF
jgi:hypothetical protein